MHSISGCYIYTFLCLSLSSSLLTWLAVMWSPDWGVGDASGGFEVGGDAGGAERCVLQEVVGVCG